MNADAYFKAGQLAAAIDEQLKAVKADPANHGKRIFLFELLVFAGDLDRARRQIDAVEYGEVRLDASVMAYRKLLDAEEARRKLASDGTNPHFFGDAPEHVHWRLEAITCMRENRIADAMARLEKADESAPIVSGRLNDSPFESVRDYDDVLGPVLEMMARGAYYWVPLDQIASIAMNGPSAPRDLIWIPANLELKSGEAGEVYLANLYGGTHAAADDALRLGRATDWLGSDDGPLRGVGAKVFRVGDKDVPLIEWRKLELA